MKYFKITITILLIMVISQSCKWFYRNAQDKKIQQLGYITDTLEVGIPNVKITVLKADTYTSSKEETDMVFYTDNNGYYKINIDNNDYLYYMKMTHEQYVYPLIQNNDYPQIVPYISDEEYNYEMVKIGKVKIEGTIMYRTNEENFLLENVKVSVLKRKTGNLNYPETTGIETYTNTDGKYHIEYEGDKNYDFFLKPEKEGYYYEHYGKYDYKEFPNSDPGFTINGNFAMKKEK